MLGDGRSTGRRQGRGKERGALRRGPTSSGLSDYRLSLRRLLRLRKSSEKRPLRDPSIHKEATHVGLLLKASV